MENAEIFLPAASSICQPVQLKKGDIGLVDRILCLRVNLYDLFWCLQQVVQSCEPNFKAVPVSVSGGTSCFPSLDEKIA